MMRPKVFLAKEDSEIVQRALGIIEGVALSIDCGSAGREALVYVLEMLDDMFTRRCIDND